MSLEFRRSWILLTCCCLIFAVESTTFGEEPLSRNRRDLMGTHPDGQRKVLGLLNTNCWRCHQRNVSKDGAKSGDISDIAISDIGSDHWILGDELSTWENSDYHRQAFASLLNEQSKQIAKQLGVVDEKGESLVHRDRRCLSCHSSMPVEQMQPVIAMKYSGNVIEDETHRNPRYTIGVSCEACHGPAGNGPPGIDHAEGWEIAHARPYDPDNSQLWWRTLSPQDKFEKFGYWDVHSPRTQARICLSCHVGNAEQQKVITHEIYAAGHPPLPSFELSQFIEQMPRHWRRLDEKPENVRNEYLQRKSQIDPAKHDGSAFDSDELAVTKATMIAALVTLEDSMQLSADLINSSATSSQWPEFANYACYACHHELQRDGWRKQHRGLTTTPGRPTLHEWPLALSRVVAATLEDEGQQLTSEINALAKALNSKPYGDSKELSIAATALAKAAELQSRKLASRKIHREQAVTFLNRIADVASVEVVDFDSARQFLWAYQRTDAQVSTIDRLGEKQLFQELEPTLLLSLKENRTSISPVELYVGKDQITRKLHQSVVNYFSTLEKVAKYDPKSVQAEFQSLRNRKLDAPKK